MRSWLALTLLATGCGPSADDLTGTWDGSSSEWGRVVMDGLQGTYSDTYGSTPGNITLERTGPGTYAGTWKETSEHGGTLTFTVDGRTATGTYTTWAMSPRRPGYEGKVLWKRQ